MTSNVITFRARRPKQELQRAFGNVSEKINDLIERELTGAGAADWRVILDRDRPAVPDDDYERCLQPE
ncbi:MAG TPA: hypothetical protein VK993_16660 [Chthoniobacterales bacterium]|nr:hypothetical protein [Chthoniobacterales bacterium]